MRQMLLRVIVLALAASMAAYAKGEPDMTIRVRSSAFEDNQPIPQRYTEDGKDVSPALSWEGVPGETRELALICDDPDAPSKEPWVHWVIYKIPGSVRSLQENIPPESRLNMLGGALQGRNSWSSGRTIGYRGPAPPPGKLHHYRFHLYALDASLPLEPNLDRAGLERAMKGHIVAEGQLTGTYQR